MSNKKKTRPSPDAPLTADLVGLLGEHGPWTGWDDRHAIEACICGWESDGKTTHRAHLIKDVFAPLLERAAAEAEAEADRLREGVERLRDEWAAAAAEDERWLNGPRVSVGEAQALPAVIANTRDHVNDLRALLDGGAK